MVSYGEVLVYPFEVPFEPRRRRVVGLETWLEVRPGSRGVGSDLVSALRMSPVRLTSLSDCDGTSVWPVEPPERLGRQLRARLLIRDEDTHLTDAALSEILAAVDSVASWTVAVKLEELDRTSQRRAL